MTKIGAILAGGRSRRMGGEDKAVMPFDGERLIDRVYGRFAPQVDEIVISGPQDYGLGVIAVPDLSFVYGGPVTGVFSILNWVRKNHPEAAGFFTAPVDGPFLPDDFTDRLFGSGPAIAADDAGVHPTFAYWTREALEQATRQFENESSVSLKQLARAIGAKSVRWQGDAHFININTPDELARWGDMDKKDRSN